MSVQPSETSPIQPGPEGTKENHSLKPEAKKTDSAAGAIKSKPTTAWLAGTIKREALSSAPSEPSVVQAIPEAVRAVKHEGRPAQKQGQIGTHTVTEVKIDDLWKKETDKMNWNKVNEYLHVFGGYKKEDLDFSKADLVEDGKSFFTKICKLKKRVSPEALDKIIYEATTPSTMLHKKERKLAARIVLAAILHQKGTVKLDEESPLRKIQFLGARVRFEEYRTTIAQKNTQEERKFADDWQLYAFASFLTAASVFLAPATLFIGVLSTYYGISYGVKSLAEKLRHREISQLSKITEQARAEEKSKLTLQSERVNSAASSSLPLLGSKRALELAKKEYYEQAAKYRAHDEKWTGLVNNALRLANEYQDRTENNRSREFSDPVTFEEEKESLRNLREKLITAEGLRDKNLREMNEAALKRDSLLAKIKLSDPTFKPE